MAQSQSCTCYTRRSSVRHIARRAHARRIARVRTVYRTVYVPQSRVASYVGYNDETYAPATRVVVTEPVYTSGGYATERIARGWGHRDGFKDGFKAALKFREYNAENNHDFRDADNGYKRRFGSKFLYKTAYREGYVRGYDTGFRSVSRSDGEFRY